MAFPDDHFPQLYRRQLDGCTNQCGPLLPGGNCTTADCVCPVVNAAGATAVNTCVNCITATDPYLASNITLTANVCMHCQSQCSSSLTAYFQSLACNSSLACSCAPFIPLGATTITTCANCIQPFDATDAAGFVDFAEECGILPSNATSTTLSSSASTTPSNSVAASTASAQSSTGSASPVATAKSAAAHVDVVGLGSLVWILLTLKTVVFAFLFV